MTLFNAFISSVEAGELPANRWVKAAVKRHQSDLKGSAKGLYYFDEEEVERVLQLFGMFRHTKGQYAKAKFQVLPWQAFLIGSLYGWKKKSDGTRRFSRAYVEVARKNGKTEVAAAIGLIEAFFNGEYGAEVYSAANKLDQASICWKSATVMGKFIQGDIPELKGFFEIHESFNNRRIFSRENNSFFAPVASDSKTLDGLNPQCAIIDEFHEATDDSILRVMETGMGSRTQPMIFIITTAGFNRLGPCFQLRKVVTDVLEGKKKDDSFFGLIFTLDEDDDWEDPAVWQKANPSLGLTPTHDFMQREYIKAKNEGETARINFLTKNLNIWTTTSKTWIKDEDWQANYEPIDMDSLLGRSCFAGLDLALTRDITAFVLFFPKENENDRHVIVSHFFIPEENAEERSRRDGVPYLQWIADGYIETTPGNATDYDYVKHRIVEEASKYHILGIGYDAAFATQLAIQLQDEHGLVMDRVPPGPTTMNQVVELIENYATWKPGPDSPVVGKFNHLNNPVLRWMMGNIVLKRDAGGRAMFDKAKSQERIDGVSALGNALARWMTVGKPEGGTSKYETEGFTIA